MGNFWGLAALNILKTQKFQEKLIDFCGDSGSTIFFTDLTESSSEPAVVHKCLMLLCKFLGQALILVEKKFIVEK